MARLIGHGAVFESLSEDLGFRETIAPQAFDVVLSAVRRGEQDVLCLVEHDPRALLGRTSAGTVRLSTDRKGLVYEVDLPETTLSRDLVAQVELRNIRQSSFSFSVAPEGEQWTIAPDGSLRRRVTEVSRLWDVSAVCTPAYLETDVSARAADDEATVGELLGRRGREMPLEAQQEIDRLRVGLGGCEMPLEAQQEIDALRFGLLEARAMEHETVIEHAALALSGVKVDRSATVRRGELQIGRRLLREKRSPSSLSATELRCLRTAEAEARRG